MGIWAYQNTQDTNLEICSTSALWNHVLPSESSLVFESRAKVRNLTKSTKYSENVKVWNSEDRISAAGHFHIWQRWSLWRTLHFALFTILCLTKNCSVFNLLLFNNQQLTSLVSSSSLCISCIKEGHYGWNICLNWTFIMEWMNNSLKSQDQNTPLLPDASCPAPFPALRFSADFF